MSYPIGRHSNTKGRHAVWLPCIRCGLSVRVMRRDTPDSDEVGYTRCRPCGQGAALDETLALVKEIGETVRPLLLAARAMGGSYSDFHARRLELWAEAVNASLTERGVAVAA